MTRSFSDAPVPKKLLGEVLEYATGAPSAGFSQGWAFVVLDDQKEIELFWEITSSATWRKETVRYVGLSKAPVIVLPLASREAYLKRYAEPDKRFSSEHPSSWNVPYWIVDTSFATMLMLLKAAELSLGVLFFRIHKNTEKLLEHLGVPSGYEPIGAVALGWPAQPGQKPPLRAEKKRPLDEVVHFGSW